MNEFTDINIARSAIGYAQIIEMLITGNETFISTNKNQLYQIGGISYTDSSPLGYVREIKSLKDKNISKLYHWHHRELKRILFCVSHADSVLYQYNIESETLLQVKFSKFTLQEFGITQNNHEYQWWATSDNGEIYRANKHKGHTVPTEW